MYYLRTKPAAQAIQFTVDKSKVMKNVQNGNKSEVENGNSVSTDNKEILACSLANKDDCLMCGS